MTTGPHVSNARHAGLFVLLAALSGQAARGQTASPAPGPAPLLTSAQVVPDVAALQGAAAAASMPAAPGSPDTGTEGGGGAGGPASGGVGGLADFQRLAQWDGAIALHAIREVTFYRQGQRLGVFREEVYVQPAGQGNAKRTSLALLELLDTNRRPLDPRRARDAYDSHAGFLLQCRDFHVVSPELAARNYDVQVVPTVVDQRPVQRYLIRPRHLDAASFELLVDPATGVTIRTREYDRQHLLVLDSQLTEWQTGSSVTFPEGRWYWTPHHTVQQHTDVLAAQAAIGAQFRIVTPNVYELQGGHALAQITTVVEPVENRSYLVLEYTDGIDSSFFVQSPRRTGVGVTDIQMGRVYRCIEGSHAQYWCANDTTTFLFVTRQVGGIPAVIQSVMR